MIHVSIKIISTGHYNTFVEKACCRRRLHQRVNFSSASGLTKNCYVIWISAKCVNIALHPFESLN